MRNWSQLLVGLVFGSWDGGCTYWQMLPITILLLVMTPHRRHPASQRVVYMTGGVSS